MTPELVTQDMVHQLAPFDAQLRVVAPPAPVALLTQLVLNMFLPDLLQNNENYIRISLISGKIKWLHVAGQVFAENGFFKRSARRMKTNIRTIKTRSTGCLRPREGVHAPQRPDDTLRLYRAGPQGCHQ